jgi:uncharacterized protein YuzB (UPF0349 family)
MIIEICEVNEAREWVDLIREVAGEDTDIIIYQCLDRCASCYLCPFVLVDGTPVEAFSLEGLLQGIRNVSA